MTQWAVRRRLLLYFGAVDKGGGRASHWPDFYNIAGNEDNLKRYVTIMCDESKVLVKETVDAKVYYKKTPKGEALHTILKDEDDPLVDQLNRNSLRPSNWYSIPKPPFDEVNYGEKHWLIVIRGVPGVGKSAVAIALEGLLPDGTVDLNLDDQPPKFPGFDVAYKARFVVGHLFSGSDRTANPRTWIDEFSRRGFHLISIVLNIDHEAGWARLSGDPKRKGNSYWSRHNYEYWYKRFYSEPKMVNFESVAGIKDIIAIDATKPTPEQIAAQILAELRTKGAL